MNMCLGKYMEEEFVDSFENFNFIEINFFLIFKGILIFYLQV